MGVRLPRYQVIFGACCITVYFPTVVSKSPKPGYLRTINIFRRGLKIGLTPNILNGSSIIIVVGKGLDTELPKNILVQFYVPGEPGDCFWQALGANGAFTRS